MDRIESDWLSNARQTNGYEFRSGDVRDQGYVDRSVEGVDVIFHMAAVVGVSSYLNDPFQVLDVNILGTRNVLLAANEGGTRIVLASTSEIYGRNPTVPWSEDDDRVLGATDVSRWSYSTSKAAGEHLAFAAHQQSGLPVTVVRYFNAYGPRQSPNYVVSRAVHRVLNRKPPLLYDGGEQTRCFTFIEDVVEGTLAAAESEAAVGETFNLGRSTESTMREVTELVLAVCEADFEWEPFSTDSTFGDTYEDIDRRVPAVSKARQILGWEAQTELEEGVRRTVQWAKSNQAWLMSPEPIEASAPTITRLGS